MDQVIQYINDAFMTNPIKNSFRIINLQRDMEKCLKAKKLLTYDNFENLKEQLKSYSGWIIGRPLAQETINAFIRESNATGISRYVTSFLLPAIQSKGLCYHYGVINGDNVIEFGTDELDKKSARVRQIPFDSFLQSLQNNTLKKVRLIHRNEFLNETTQELLRQEPFQERSQELLDKYNVLGDTPNTYDALSNNCDHTAHYISCGNNKSIQQDIITKYMLCSSVDQLIEEYQRDYYVIDLSPISKK